jgi:hypothetical protein
MNKQAIIINAISLVGISTRTNNTNELNQATSKIPKLIDKYFREKNYKKR